MAIKASNQVSFTEQKKIIEIKEWYLSTNENIGITRDTDGWSENVQLIDYTKSYLWNWEEIIYSIGESDKSEPVIISSYGKGISNIKNYYQVTDSLVAPELPKNDKDTCWSDASITTNLSPINKYLWSYTSITYTDGSTTNTDPAIIGVYGDSGESSVTFEIYSVQGFIFKEDVNEIELKVAAFQGTTQIENATFTWEWFDQTLNNGDGEYSVIVEDTDSKSLYVSKKDMYAFSHLKCSMKYNDQIYEDYVDLSRETIVYTTSVGFFNGSNIFDNTSKYLIAYINLYRNNLLVETVVTNKYYIGENSVNDGIIETDVEGEFSDNDLMYFIYEDKITYIEMYNDNENESSQYKEIEKTVPCAVLGKYKSKKWNVAELDNNYLYINDLYNYVTSDKDIYSRINSNVIVISREDVSKSKIVNFDVYKKQIGENNEFIINDELYLSSVSTTVIDTNDPIVSDTAPTNVKDGQLWLDTSTTPYTLKIYTKYFKQQYIYGEIDSNIISTSGSKYNKETFLYGDEKDIVLLNDGNICMSDSCNTVDIYYYNYTDANVLKGKFYCKKDSTVVYYVEPDTEITRWTSESSMPNVGKVTHYFVEVLKTRLVKLDTNDGKWDYFSQQNGGTVYTSKPSSYKKGDLWILSDGEVCKEFGPGTMLKATATSDNFMEDHWTDVMEETTKVINNIKQYLTFNADTGLKIGQKDEKFYVNISSTEMGFYDNSEGQNQKVVNISNNSANIQNAIFDGSNNTTFNNAAVFNKSINIKFNENSGFIWQTESNGSFSLVVL